MIASESSLTIGLHGVTLAVGVAQLGLLLKLGGPILREYKIWSRVKERVNTLWFHRCEQNGEPYVPLENGKQ